jgi:predicted aconitase with swiveling domain
MGKDNALTFNCHRISGGSTEGQVLISPEPVCFYMIDTDTGKINESSHALVGQSITDKVLVLPSGKGSSVVQDEGLFALKQKNKGPKGIIVKTPDTVLVAGTIVMDYPLFDRVDKEFYVHIENGDYVRIDANRELIMLVKKKAC